jgi:DNA-binding response OmpR family regulator
LGDTWRGSIDSSGLDPPTPPTQTDASGGGPGRPPIRTAIGAADDYPTEPFTHGELLARIRAHIRRVPSTTVSADMAHGVYMVGQLCLDTGVRRVTREDRVIDVSAREFDILRRLAEAAGRVVERQQLFTSVWGPSFYGDERALDVYIRMIRKKIEPDPNRPMYLHTVRGVGYRLAEERVPDER